MKLIVLSALLCIGICAGAQVHYALKAGPQLSTASFKREGNKIAAGNIAGFNAGLLAKVYFDDRVAFVTGVAYSSRGYKIPTQPGDTIKTYRLNYIDIPLLIQVDFSATKGAGFYGKLGPSLGIGLSGKEIYTGRDGQEIRNKAILSVTGNHFGLFDASVNAAFGYSFNRFFAELGYAYGIGNIDNDPDGPNIKTRVASLNLGYFFR